MNESTFTFTLNGRTSSRYVVYHFVKIYLLSSHTFNLSGFRIRRPEGKGVYELQMTLLTNICVSQ